MSYRFVIDDVVASTRILGLTTNLQKLRPGDSAQYLLPWLPADQDNFPDEAQRAKIGSRSPITRYWQFLTFLKLPTLTPGLSGRCYTFWRRELRDRI